MKNDDSIDYKKVTCPCGVPDALHATCCGWINAHTLTFGEHTEINVDAEEKENRWRIFIKAKQPSDELLNALGDLLSGDSGCPMCDSGILRNPEKEHWDDCKWANALKTYNIYKAKQSQPSTMKIIKKDMEKKQLGKLHDIVLSVQKRMVDKYPETNQNTNVRNLISKTIGDFIIEVIECYMESGKPRGNMEIKKDKMNEFFRMSSLINKRIMETNDLTKMTADEKDKVVKKITDEITRKLWSMGVGWMKSPELYVEMLQKISESVKDASVWKEIDNNDSGGM